MMPAPAIGEGAILTAATDVTSDMAEEPEHYVLPTPAPTPPLRVMIVSHMHPRVSRGGAEIAAYQMYESLRAMPGVRTWFVAASGGKIIAPLGTVVFQPFGEDEFVLGDVSYDHWSHSSHNSNLAKEFRLLLQELQPDIIHFHHFVNIGIESLLYIKQILPNARVVITLHEFLAICNHFGQMVKRPSMDLCEASSIRSCAKCFPERSENDFFLRKMYLKRFMDLADHLISPSHFLADRYTDWGVDPAKLSVVENGQPPFQGEPVPLPDPSTLIVGFFGQLSTLKGVGVLLDASAELRRKPPKLRTVRLEVYGDASNQPPELREEIERRLEASRSVVTFRGAYDNRKVHALMQGCHAVLVPSIWWENSPLVIQEAFAARRPVICSDIGGMAEKVRHGLDGFQFLARSGLALAELLRDLAEKPERLEAVQRTLSVPPTLDETVKETKNIYDKLCAQ